MSPLRDQQPARRHQASNARPSVEVHGRVVTASQDAAAFYRLAQQAVHSPDAVRALGLAIEADPAFGLAVADLDAMTAAPPSPIHRRQMGWERHHVEVVRTAAAGNVDRASDLLRELLTSIGCDPLALRILTDACNRVGRRNELQDLTDQLPGCHRAAWN
jgi:hypothetical protein